MFRLCLIANEQLEQSDQGRDLDEGDDLIVDITNGPRTIAEEGYSLPVIIDPEDGKTTLK
jgi:hypothetical protein